MSVAISSLVWKLRLPAMDKIVLLRLAEFADPDGGRIFPAVATLVADCGASERHIQGVLGRYRTAGLLLLVRAGGGRHRPNHYRFNLDLLKAGLAPAKPGSADTPSEPYPVAGAHPPAAGAAYPAATSVNPASVAHDPSSAARTPDDDESGPDHLALGRAIARRCGLDGDPAWFGDFGPVKAWLAQGAEPALILAIVEDVLARAAGKDIRSLRYFNPAIARALKERAAGAVPFRTNEFLRKMGVEP